MNEGRSIYEWDRLRDLRVAASRAQFRLHNAVASIAIQCVMAFAVAVPPALCGGIPGDVPPSEMEVKANLVLNFIRLVSWDSIGGKQIGPDLPVCALANSEFSEAVKRAVAGKTVGNRSISFRVTTTPDASQCRILIVDLNQYRTARPAIVAVKNDPVLTIGNGPGLTQIGGMFDLIAQARKVQFDANLDAIRHANLDISARLLQLSRNLRKGGAGAF